MVSGKVTRATEALSIAQIAHRVVEYHHEAGTKAYGVEAAMALGVEPSRVHKTLLASVETSSGHIEVVVAVVPVDAQLDLKALALAVGAKRAVMTSATEAERVTGYVVGGISPIGQRKQLRTVIDEDAILFDTIFVSGGRRGLDIELTAEDLAIVTAAVFAPLAKR